MHTYLSHPPIYLLEEENIGGPSCSWTRCRSPVFGGHVRLWTKRINPDTCMKLWLQEVNVVSSGKCYSAVYTTCMWSTTLYTSDIHENNYSLKPL